MQYLPRHLEKQILEAAHYFKAVLLLGARQSGKSTLLSHLFPTIKHLVFDPIQDLYNARKDPDLFLDSFPAPIILDEVQYVPELLPALKRKMDRQEKKGLYFLTGSQNFSVLRSISESMAGRVAVFHLENLTLLEMSSSGNQPGWITRYLANPEDFVEGKAAYFTKYSLIEWLFRGSFPGLAQMPTSQVPLYFRSYLQTYVDRDVRSQEDIRQLAEFDRFLGMSSMLTAQEINSSQLGREIGISPHTARRWLDLLTYSYQWVELQAYHGNTIKRISGKKKGYIKDSGFACFLQKIESTDTLAISTKLGALFETAMVGQIQQQLSCLFAPPSIYHWRTAGGAEVDLILEKEGKLFPIEMKCKTNLTKADLSGLKAFRETYSNTEVMPGLILYAGSEIFKLDAHTFAIPWNLL